MRPYKLALVGMALVLAGISTSCNKLKARDQLNKGVLSFRNAQYAQAVDHFQEAVTLDPTLVNARLFLAVSLEQQYVPGGVAPENMRMGDAAIQAFQRVLQLDPKNINALQSIAQIYYQMNKYDQAKQYQQKLMTLEPNNPDPYYWVGVLNYIPCQRRQMQLRNQLNVDHPKLNILRLNTGDHDSYPPLPARDRDQLAQQNGALIDEGIQMLQKAIDLKPNDANAYSYLNLMYRQKADIETDRDAREADLQKADHLASKALALMKSGGGRAASSSGTS
ncbi:MAG: tetratricopeptide repeat protein [Terriglobia bacterium]